MKTLAAILMITFVTLLISDPVPEPFAEPEAFAEAEAEPEAFPDAEAEPEASAEPEAEAEAVPEATSRLKKYSFLGGLYGTRSNYLTGLRYLKNLL